MGGGNKIVLNRRNQHLFSFYVEHLESLKLLTFLSVKTDLAAPIIMFLDPYLISYSELVYINPVKVINKYAKITVLIASEVIRLYSSYTVPYLVAEFI